MKNNEIRVKNCVARRQAVDYLQDVVNSLRSGRVCVEHAEQSVTLSPPGDVTVQVKASAKEDKQSISVKISWRIPGEDEADETDLRIADQPSVPAPAKDTSGV